MYAFAEAASVNTAALAVGTPAAAINALAQALLASICAPALFGPNTIKP